MKTEGPLLLGRRSACCALRISVEWCTGIKFTRYCSLFEENKKVILFSLQEFHGILEHNSILANRDFYQIAKLFVINFFLLKMLTEQLCALHKVAMSAPEARCCSLLSVWNIYILVLCSSVWNLFVPILALVHPSEAVHWSHHLCGSHSSFVFAVASVVGSDIVQFAWMA